MNGFIRKLYSYTATSSHRPTYDTKRFSGKAETSLPASIAATAASTPYPDDVLQAKHYNHHKLLQDAYTIIHTLEPCNIIKIVKHHNHHKLSQDAHTIVHTLEPRSIIKIDLKSYSFNNFFKKVKKGKSVKTIK